MIGKPWIRRLLVALLALGGVTWTFVLGADEPLRLSRNVPGDFGTIVLHADQIATWVEGDNRIFLLRGLVFVHHGTVQARMQQAVGWVNQANTRRTGVMRIDLYGEGNVRLEDGADIQTGETAWIDLHTRGELKLKAQAGRVIRQAMPNDPFYRRALTALKSKQNAGSLQQTQYKRQATDNATRDRSTSAGSQGTAQRPGAATPPGSGSTAKKKSPVTPAISTSMSPTAPHAIQRTDYSPTSQTTPATPAQGLPRVVPPSVHIGEPRTTPLQPPAAPPSAMPGVGNPPAASPSGSSLPAPPRHLRIVPRTQAPFQVQEFPLANGEKAYVVTGGVILTVSNPQNRGGLIDIEADRLVVWTRGDTGQLFRDMRSERGSTTRSVEVYLAGNVEIRETSGSIAPQRPRRQPRNPEEARILRQQEERGQPGRSDGLENRVLRADEVYYDLGRNVAVAYQASLRYTQQGLPDPIFLRADELLQLSPKKFEAVRAEVFSSKLPSDPGLKVFVNQAILEERQVPKKSIFGTQVIDRETGQPVVETERLFTGKNVFFEIADIPVAYLPFVQGDAEDPLGPLKSLSVGYNRIFGTQVYTSFNVYDLFGIDPLPATRWRLDIDYLSRRGPAVGTDFDYFGKDFLGLEGKNNGRIFAYGIYDRERDFIGGNRGIFPHPDWRGWALWRHYQELPEDFTLQFQVSALSDKNFLEQFFYNEWNRDVNQETFFYLKQQRGIWAWTVIAEPNIRNWITETERLPQFDGYLIGQSFFDLFNYNAHASVGYLRLKTTDVPPPPVGLTELETEAARLDLWQELSLPFYAGPVKLVPYGVVDLAYYSNDLTGSDRGRFYGGGGARASLPFARFYPSIQSDLFNINGIHHKIIFGANYYIAHSDTPFTRLPQFDRLNDDPSDQALRDITPLQPALNPANGRFLATSALFDPQVYAIRRLVDNRVDTLDTIEVLQGNIRQRWQTKRGYPGMQHIVDWMVLDFSTSFFPHSGRDNFGEAFAFFEYDWLWNIGDRTALVSNGWFDPIGGGARVYNIGAFLNRPDRTNFYVGYRQIDPLQSRLVSASVSYILSPKYAVTGSTSYDFGTTQSLSNSLVFTRMGSDLMISFGINYNAILNNFGITFQILPNVASRPGQTAMISPSSLLTQ